MKLFLFRSTVASPVTNTVQGEQPVARVMANKGGYRYESKKQSKQKYWRAPRIAKNMKIYEK